MNDEAKEQVQVRHVEEEEGESINTCSYHGLGQREVVVIYYYSDSGRVYDRIGKNGKATTELVEY